MGDGTRATLLPTHDTNLEALLPHEHRRRRAVPVHVRIGDRGPPGQALRPGLGRRPRRVPAPGSVLPRRMRGGHHDRHRHGPRRDHDQGRVRGRRGDRSRDREGDRLHEGRVRLRLPDLRHAGLDQGAVVGHRPGRGFGARGPRGCRIVAGAWGRRPGHDVRVRLPRDPRADATADRAGASDGPPSRRGPQVRPAALPAPRREDPGDDRIRARRPEAGQDRGRVGPARPGHPRRATALRHRRDGHPSLDPVRTARLRPDHARQPDRPVRRGRTDG